MAGKPAKRPVAKTTVAAKPDRWFTPQKPEYLKLVIGESITGVYLGTQQSSYGPNYRFSTGEGKVVAINGNRVQIDQLMEQVEAANLKGHLLVIERIPDDTSTKGRTVHQYRIGHIPNGCPVCKQG